jgi:hypothetical protein
MEVRTTVDYATAAWKGDVGVVTTLIERLTIDPAPRQNTISWFQSKPTCSRLKIGFIHRRIRRSE